ncbi:MAG: hypothetical protein U9O41_05705 [Candidatus Aerophobetes bacterium]|nr:hypothetical protein [Candidatus Aerophobetes bacterium]
MTIHPELNAMLICDQVITEKETNKKSLIGIFENISAHKFPFGHPSLSLYIKLTGAKGKYKFRLELVDLEKNIIIGKGETPETLNFDDPLRTFELVFGLKMLKFEHPGKYEFRIFANNEIFGQKTFQVIRIPERGY